MSGYILRGGQENITLPAAAVESLLRRGEGDAACCIWRCSGSAAA